MKLKPLTKEKLWGASVRETLHHSHAYDSTGGCQRWRVNGKMKTWVTRPNEFWIPIKFGMNVCSAITQANVGWWHLESECPYLRFKELDHGDVFEFRRHWFNKGDPMVGPWKRISEKRYTHPSGETGNNTYKVGSINAWVRRIEDGEEE